MRFMNRILRGALTPISAVSLHASDVGEDFGIERASFVNPVTNVRIWELTHGTNAADNLYSHFSNFTADNRYLIFVSKDGSARLVRQGNYWHTAARPDGAFLVADDMQGRLWLNDSRRAEAVSRPWIRRCSQPASLE